VVEGVDLNTLSRNVVVENDSPRNLRKLKGVLLASRTASGRVDLVLLGKTRPEAAFHLF